MLCRHCHKTRSNRPRGLCWTCYYTPGVRELFPSTSKFARRGVGNFNGNAPLPDQPTDAAPGSEAKIRVLMERARLKQALFHPADAGGGVADSSPLPDFLSAETLTLREAG